ncbi:rho GTPase-activating protein 29-like isoform X2 [Entelurus aequoreus]|uniref:rho GTPase-activating protein 29-like isoform X2 n=1 Tax=Entelurus aequoreus TaxID=161455 RepID=UPI002B1DEB2B|nr:rho GTPase-activating protein 29-like isoform X2 [Entelurus aequoreus]
MLAAIQHHSTGARAGGGSGGGGGGGDGGGSSGGGGGGETTVPLGSSRFSISTTTAGSASMSTRAPEGPPMHSRSLDNSASDPNYIWQTVDDIRKFAEVLLHLKEAFNFAEHPDGLQQVVDKRLDEMLEVLKGIIGKHESLNWVTIHSTAGAVAALVKKVNFKEVNENNKQSLFSEIHSAIDQLAYAISNVVSDFFMGDVENGLGLPLTEKSTSFDNPPLESRGSLTPEKDDPPGSPTRVEEVDRTLLQQDNGVELALRYAKAWSKYTKEMLTWVEKRFNMDVELAKYYSKMAESAKTLASQQEFMPFCEIYTAAFKNDIEYSKLIRSTAAVLQSNKYVQPLTTRKNELDKLRKEMKEQWQRQQKRLHEAQSAQKKAELQKSHRKDEYDKAKESASRLKEEQTGGPGGAVWLKQREKRRRLEEEALQKDAEARQHYDACCIDVKKKTVDLAKTKSDIITQLRKMVFQCDLTLKAVTVNWFQLQQAQVAALPVNHQSLCDHAKLYEPGQRYVKFVRRVSANGLDSSGGGMSLTNRTLIGSHSSSTNLSQSSVTSDLLGVDEVDGSNVGQQAKTSADARALQRHSTNLTSQGGGMCSDSESAGGSSESRSIDSPTASPGDFMRKIPRTPSTGTMSSADDLDEREPPSSSDHYTSEVVMEDANSPGPFRNTQMSKAAQTHKLRKLRSPSKCRECDGLIVFQGAECEECSLACHKKCLESLAIQCGHRKLQRKLQLFGVDFTQTASNSQDDIPFIIRKCTSEIETRALNLKFIYRINGAKSRVEKLCQAFENGKDLVEMSNLYPHDISNVLKLYLRQLPEPLILFRYYNDLIGLAKDSQSGIGADLEASRLSSSPVPPAQVSVELNRILFKIKDILRQLPHAQYKTLQFLVEHLHRVTEQSEENKMTARNLGIIFGPTLIKPRQTDAEVSLSSLVDYPYQALIVELIIRHYQMIFDTPLSPSEVGARPIPATRLTPQDKERRLSRYSKSAGHDQETSAKGFRRHSFTPSRLLNESADTVPTYPSGSEGKGFQGADEPDSKTCNGVWPLSVTDPPKPSERGLTRSPHVTAPSLRQHRPRLASRPASMPAQQSHYRGSADDNPTWAGVDEDEDGKGDRSFQSILEVDETGPKVRAGTLRGLWNAEYKHVASKAAKTVPGADNRADDVSPLEDSGGPYSDGPYSIPARPGRVLRREDNVTVFNMASKGYRASRTLNPPPETFYKPPSASKDEDEKEDVEIEVSVDHLERAATSPSPSHSPDPEEVYRPLYQRPRTRSRPLQEAEHREAHFV